MNPQVPIEEEKEILITLKASGAEIDCTPYGFRLRVPPGALPENISECIISIQVRSASQYEFPDDSDLVSVVYKILSPVKFRKPVVLEIQHCALIKTAEQIPFLTFVRAEENIFQPIAGGKFSITSSYATISVENFSSFAVILQNILSFITFGYYTPQVDYRLIVYVTPTAQRKWEVFCIIAKNLNAILTVSLPQSCNL